MEKLLEKLAEYELLNNLLPGALFCILFEWHFHIHLQEYNAFVEILIFYSVGMIIGRFGSLIVEPMCKWRNFIQFADYSSYIKASEKDPTIKILSEKNNMYRSFASMFVLCLTLLVPELLLKWATTKFFPMQIFLEVIGASLVGCLFFYSYKKQTDYIRNRISTHIKETQGGN